MTKSAHSRRGCVYFNFGRRYALHLVVSVHSLRRHYDGPITVFLLDESHTATLKRDLEKLDASVVVTDRLSKSGGRHLVFSESPYDTTPLFDSVIFRAPIDDLWEPLEREGALVTRFFPPPASRLKMLDGVAPLVGQERFERAVVRVGQEGVDVLQLDGMLVVALAGHRPHYLADEQWNCAADEKYCSIDPAEKNPAFLSGRRSH